MIQCSGSIVGHLDLLPDSNIQLQCSVVRMLVLRYWMRSANKFRFWLLWISIYVPNWWTTATFMTQQQKRNAENIRGKLQFFNFIILEREMKCVLLHWWKQYKNTIYRGAKDLVVLHVNPLLSSSPSNPLNVPYTYVPYLSLTHMSLTCPHWATAK